MRYASGKSRISQQLAAAVHTHTQARTLASLFCGGLSVEIKLAPYFDNIICNDKQPYLIAMYQALQEGWIPPDELDEQTWRYIKTHKEENPPLTGFAGFGCSFGGHWFDGYGRHGTKDKHEQERSMCNESKRALIRDLDFIKRATFTCLDYREVEIPNNSVIYCDPPYRGKTTKYGIKEKFDSDAFWEWARVQSRKNHIYISELEAPDDFIAIWQKPVLRQVANCDANNFVSTEKLFVYKENT